MICKICGCELTAGTAVGCARCGAPFHFDCFEFNGGCAIYGCDCSAHLPYRPNMAMDPVPVPTGFLATVRWEPYVERCMLAMPRGWELEGVAALFGVLGSAAFVAGLVAVDASKVGLMRGLGRTLGLFTVPGFALYCLAGPLAALLALGCGPVMRTRRAVTALVGYAVAGLFFVGTWAIQTTFGTTLGRPIAMLGLMVPATLASAAVAEAFVPSTRKRAAAAVVRALLTVFVLFAVLAMATVLVDERHSTAVIGEIFVYSFLGLAAALPPLELSKSALAHRVKAEIARSGGMGLPPVKG